MSAIDVKDIGLCDDNGNLVNGHYAITCILHHHAAEIKSKSVSYRQLKSINTARFKQDIQASAILNNTPGTAEHVIETYKEGLSSLLDIHAPLVCRTITPDHTQHVIKKHSVCQNAFKDLWNASGVKLDP